MATNIWDEWKALTRFTESGRLAMAREGALWTELQLANPQEALVTYSPNVASTYSVKLEDHVAAVSDEVPLLSSVLLHSYALAEAAACDVLGVDSRQVGGIEDWGKKLLVHGHQTRAQVRAQNGLPPVEEPSDPWEKVLDGLSGAVEVAVCRNTFAHASRRVDQGAANRLAAAGSTRWATGDVMTLTYADLRLYRDRLKSLLRLGRVGTDN